MCKCVDLKWEWCSRCHLSLEQRTTIGQDLADSAICALKCGLLTTKTASSFHAPVHLLLLLLLHLLQSLQLLGTNNPRNVPSFLVLHVAVFVSFLFTPEEINQEEKKIINCRVHVHSKTPQRIRHQIKITRKQRKKKRTRAFASFNCLS